MINYATALYQTAAIRQLENLAMTTANISADELMHRAAHAALQLLRERWPNAKKIAVICGKGNNGGDGMVLAQLAKKADLRVSIYSVTPATELSGLPAQQAQACRDAGMELLPIPSTGFQHYDVLVDALLGIGLVGEVSGVYQSVIQLINSSHLPVLALDVPSGLDADTGALHGCVVKANVTATFIGLKLGLMTGAGPEYSGDVYCDELGIPQQYREQAPITARLLGNGESKAWLPKRPRDAHKGLFGHVLVIGGDYGMPGAVRMAAEAAARVGAGLTTVATHPEHIAVVSSMRPELMCHGIVEATQLQPLIAKATVIVLGPGLGQSEWSKSLWQVAMASALPKVVDADGLNLLAKMPQRFDNWVLTPHPGEAGRLLQTEHSSIQADRLAAAQALQQRYGGVCVLKGVGTLIVAAEQLPAVCTAGNPGMSSGGMGDVLSGVIAGLMAQGLLPWQAAQLGAYIHGQAADRAALEGGERGLLALDLMSYLQRLVNPN